MTAAIGILCLAALGAWDCTSQFRASTSVLTKPSEAQAFWRQIDAHPKAFDEISVFNQGTGAVLPLDFHRDMARRVPAFLAEARKRGLRAGVNVLCTVGFNEEAYDPALDVLPQRVSSGGTSERGTICSGSPEVLAYVAELYRIYAETRPDFLYIDDDTACVCDCRCPVCVRRFARESGLLSAETATLADLYALFASSDLNLRRRVREAWLAFTCRRRTELYETAARSAHAVDPRIGMGVMTCSAGNAGLDNARWAKALGEGGDSSALVRWRPGGGCWRGDSLDAMLDNAERNAVQVFGLPETVCLQAEIENYPYQALAKHPDFMGFEALTDLGWGCNGVAWSLATVLSSDYIEFGPYFAKVEAFAPAARLVVSAMGRHASEGIAYPWDATSAVDVVRPDWKDPGTVPLPYELERVGFPVASDPARAVVTLLDASSASHLGDAALRRVLSGGALIDAGAIEVVVSRGMGELVGVRPAGEAPREAIVRDLEHPLNAPGRNYRDIRVFLGRSPGVRLLEPVADGVEATVEAVNFGAKPYGTAGTVFENALGGRIAVETMVPFGWCEGTARLEHVRRLFRWLSRDRLPAYVASTHRLALRCRGGSLLAANVSGTTARKVEVASRGALCYRCTIMAGGEIVATSDLKPVRSDGAYSFYAVPDIPHLGHALLVPAAACPREVLKEPLAPFPQVGKPRRLTNGPHEHFLANYFAINAWSSDFRYVLVLETDLNGRLPEAGERCTIGLVDTRDENRFIPVSTTACWNFQEAAMGHWLTDDEIAFNDLRDGKFVTVVMNWRTKSERLLPMPISALSEDRRWAVSVNYARLFLTRPDYGYAGDGQDAREKVEWPEDDGLWIMDMQTGETKLILSVAAGRSLMPDTKAVPGKPGNPLAYYCHTVISKDGEKIFFLARSVDWYEKKTHAIPQWHTTSFTVNRDGTDLRRCFPDGWGGSHFNWAPDGSHKMLVTCAYSEKGAASEFGYPCTLVEFEVGKEKDVRRVTHGAMEHDWHCIYSPNGKFMSGESYMFRDNERPWVIIRLADGMTMPLGAFAVPAAYRSTYWRCDLHARWRPDGKQLGFNSVHEGSRQVYVMDVTW